MLSLPQVLRAVAAAEHDSVEGVEHPVCATLEALGIEVNAAGQIGVYLGNATLAPLLQAVAKAEGDTIAGIEHTVLATIKALGLEVFGVTGEIYNPAAGAYARARPEVWPRDERWGTALRKRRR